MKIIIGLGNPGGKYRYTRHNIGFMVVNKLVKDLLPVDKSEGSWKKVKKHQARICRIDKETLIAKPETYMNKSGESVSSLVKFYKIKLDDLWVIHDDIDLPLGKIRIRKGGGSAGHNGIESIIEKLGSDNFIRYRLGIGRGKLSISKSTNINIRRRTVHKYVLSKFSDRQAGEMKKLIKKSSLVIRTALSEDIKKAMNKFN